MNVYVCHSPLLYPLYSAHSKIVVVIDVLRATSAICTAFEYGVSKMIPVSSVDEAVEYQRNGFLAAAERDGLVVKGFDLGNSPFGYMNDKIKNKTIAITTTNGTKAINAAQNADNVIIGSFLNFDAIVNYLHSKQKNVCLLCAGWKDKYNLEDTLFAGAVAKELMKKGAETDDDATIAAVHLFDTAEGNLQQFLENSSHRQRLGRLDLEKDIEFCLSYNKTNVIPVMEGKYLIKMKC